jgi:hypothetical protein
MNALTPWKSWAHFQAVPGIFQTETGMHFWKREQPVLPFRRLMPCAEGLHEGASYDYLQGYIFNGKNLLHNWLNRLMIKQIICLINVLS